MELSLSTKSKQAYIQINGTLDEAGAEELKSRIQQLCLDELEELVFDFKAVKHIGSAGIGKLLLFYKDIAPHGGILRIENTPPPIFDLLNMLKLDAIFKISRQSIKAIFGQIGPKEVQERTNCASNSIDLEFSGHIILEYGDILDTW